MASPPIPDDEFIALWEALGSASAVAAHLKQTERAVYNRRKRIQARKDIDLLNTSGHHSANRYIANSSRRAGSARLHLDIENGHVLVGSDAHYYPGYASTAHRAFVKLCGDIRPRAVIMNGDVFDGGSISRHPRIGWDHKPTVIEELRAVDERLTEIEAAARTKELYWPLGNHCARFETFLAANAPQYEGVKGFSLKDHFPMWRPCWSVWINQDTVIKHRMRNGVHAAHNNTVNSGLHSVTGHLHALKVTPFTDYRGTRFGVDTGTLADAYDDQFDYMEDGPRNWRSGFVLLTFHKRRLLWPQVVHVIDNGLVEFGTQVFEV